MNRNLFPFDQAQQRLYEQGMDIGNVFENFPGVCVLPLAEDPPTTEEELKAYSPVVVLRLHAPYRKRNVTYKAAKDSNPPVMPAPVDAGSFKFVGGQTIVHNSLRQDNLGFDWQMACVYSYIELAVPLPSDGLVLGTPPWIWPQVATMIKDGHIIPATPSTGAVATAGPEVLFAKFSGDSIDPTNGKYTYQFPSYYPGSFYNNFMVNGGPPTISDPRQGGQV